jgi:cytochrome b subunit of formate dehydrogenase
MTFLILAATVLWAVYSLRSGGGSLRRSLGNLVAGAGDSSRTLRRPGAHRAVDLLAALRVLLYFLAAVSVLALAITGFVPYWVWGQRSSGFSLLVHVAFAPVFAVCVTGLVLLWAHRQRLDAWDLEWARRSASRPVEKEAGLGREGRQEGDGPRAATSPHSPKQKLVFWGLVLLSPLVMGSIMMGMYPIFATPGQRALLMLHLIAGLLFVILAIVQVVLLVSSSTE